MDANIDFDWTLDPETFATTYGAYLVKSIDNVGLTKLNRRFVASWKNWVDAAIVAAQESVYSLQAISNGGDLVVDSIRVVKAPTAETSITLSTHASIDTAGDKRIQFYTDEDAYLGAFFSSVWNDALQWSGIDFTFFGVVNFDGVVNTNGLLQVNGGIDTNGTDVTTNGGDLSTNGGDFTTVGGNIDTVGGDITCSGLNAGTTTFGGDTRLWVRTNANRGSAATAGVGAVIFNSDDNTLNVSDGTNWRDMVGLIT